MAQVPPSFPVAVNAQHRTPGYQWSQERARKAAEKQGFIRVAPGQTQSSRRYLTGAKNRWASANPEENNAIFIARDDVRISGNVNDVVAALREAGIDDNTIANLVAGAITKENYQTTMKAAYDAEIARRKGLSVNKAQPGRYRLEDAEWFAANLKEANKGTAPGKATGGGRSATTDRLDVKYHNLPPNKVLDVSKIDLATGKGYRTVDKPQGLKTTKGGKVLVAGLNIISNNIERYVRALEFIFGQDARQRFAREIGEAQQRLTPVAPRIGQTVGFPTPGRLPQPAAAPAALPGATLAAPVQFSVPSVRTPGVPTLGNQFQPLPSLAGVPSFRPQ